MVVGRVAGPHFPIPIEGETQQVQLLAVARDVFLCGFGRVLPGLYRVLFGGQAVGIETHRVQHVEALQAFVPGVDVAGDIAERMPYMQSCPGGVREHVQDVVFGFG